MKPANTSYVYIDHLRVLACVAVIVIHVTLGSLESLPAFSTLWWIGHMICLTSQWAVPVFVMISGALLLGPRQETSEAFFSKRVRRIGWPLVFWTTVYFVIRKVFDHEPVTAGYVLEHLVQADPPYHTYFLWLIAGLYLVTPLVRTLIQHATQQQRVALIGLIFVLSSGYALANAWFWGNGRFVLSFFVPYLGYYLAGYELTQLPFGTVTRRHYIWAVGLSVIYTVLIASPYLDHLGRQNGRFVLGYFSVPVMVMSVAVFRAAWLWEQQRIRPMSRLDRWAHSLSSATFGIYLVHVAVLIGLREAMAGQDTDNSQFLVNVVLGTVAAFALSYGITVLMQKTPGFKRLV